MKRAAIGISVHSGWGALVAISRNSGAIEVIDRRRIVIVDPTTVGASQPYHFAQNQELHEAEKHLADCAAVSERLAFSSLRDLVQELRLREYTVVGCAILLASDRSLPALLKILASHALIHTAEGEFFREAFRRACGRLDIHVAGIRERDLKERMKTSFGSRANRLRGEIANLGASLGPPWTKDQKGASMAALVALEDCVL
jgi:hypothetical protein